MPESKASQIIDAEWANVFRNEITHEETVEGALRRIKIFSLLSDRELSRLARIVHVRHYLPGETVMHRGVEQSGFYMVLRGSVDIVRDRLDGPRQVVANLGAHQLLGEFALLDSTPRNSSIVAAESSQLIGFFKPDLMEILTTNPVLGCKILLRLAEEMSRSLATDYQMLRDQGYPFPESADADALLKQADPTLA